MRSVLFALMLLVVFGEVQSSAEVLLDPLGNPVSEELLEQAKSLRSIIIVLNDVPAQPLSDEGPALAEIPELPGVGALKKVFPTEPAFRAQPLGDGLPVNAVSDAKRNLDNMYVADLLVEGGAAEALSQIVKSPRVKYAEPD